MPGVVLFGSTFLSPCSRDPAKLWYALRMRTSLCTALQLVLVVLGFAGCQSSPDVSSRTAVQSTSASSVFRVQAEAVTPVASDQIILIKCWSVDCLDPADPDSIALLGRLPSHLAQTEDQFDPDVIASHLESLDEKQQLRIHSMPVLMVRGGDAATMEMTEPIDWPDLQAGVERDESLFPFAVGERLEIGTAFDEEGFIVLDVDYSRGTLTGTVDESVAGVRTSRVQQIVRLRSGESVVLGGWRSVRDDAGGVPEEAAHFVVINARAMPPVPPQQAAR